MPAGQSKSFKLASTASKLLYGIAGWMLVGLGTFGLVMTFLRILSDSAPVDPVLSATVMLISMVFVLLGLFVNPRFRRRLDRRHPLTRFGRIQSVDERILHPAEGRTVRCVSCGSRLNKGLVRRYREEVCIAGVPAVTRSDDCNHYCVECAATEFGSTTWSEDSSDGSANKSKKQTQPATERR